MSNVQSLINMSTLARLADADTEAQLVDLGAMALNPDIKESLARQGAKRKAEVVDAAAGEILNLVQNSEAFMARQVSMKAALLEQISGIDKTTAAVAKARAYGFSTNNFLPLASSVGMSLPAGTKEALKSIPKDWTVPAAATTTAA